MKLSVIIPNFNGEKTVLKTIASVKEGISFLGRDYEIILIDDFSNDTSLNLVKSKFREVKQVSLKARSGAAKARNEGIKEAKGQFILFIDNDAWLRKNAIKTMLSHMDYATDIVFPKILFENGKQFYPVFEVEESYPHISCCFLIKKSSINIHTLLFDETYETYLEDNDFFMRCKLKGLKAGYAESAVVTHADKIQKDYSYRYYLEVRNTVYGMRKLGGLAKKSGLYNPFTLLALLKAFCFGIINFAWFNWQHYDRRHKGAPTILFKNKNPISKKRLNLLFLFFKGLLKGLGLPVK